MRPLRSLPSLPPAGGPAPSKPPRNGLRLPGLLLAAALLSACAGGAGRAPVVEQGPQARAQSSRVEFVVIHYTSAGSERSLRLLSGPDVSSHYLITDDEPPRIVQLVDENRRAWHAGDSAWYGRTYLNASSIGIEIVNPGGAGDSWAPYRADQIQALQNLLRDIVQRHGIAAQNIVGHSDIAPLRKTDPGPLFPWRELAQAGLGRWYDEQAAALWHERYLKQGLPDAAWIQQQLLRVGYAVPQTGALDAATRRVLAAFQMHYRPARHDGTPDAETLAILQALP